MEEEGFLYINTLQEVTIMLPGSVDEMLVCFSMPYSYTISDVGMKIIVIKALGSEKM
jgi:hypothetical protein